MNIERIIRKLRACVQIMKGMGKPSFSQHGEDRVLELLFTALGIKHPTYIDIGCNHPVLGSNTFGMYLAGSHGVCVDADEELCRDFSKARPRDTVVNAGIAFSEEREADFYIFPKNYTGLNSFSKEEVAVREKEMNIKVRKVARVPLMSVNELFAKYCPATPDFMSLDIEGLDYSVLQSMDLKRYRPKVICVETIAFQLVSGKAEKIDAITELLKANGYFVFADTHANTIFCSNEAYGKEQKS